MTLAEFLLARIAEDEAVAREADGEDWIMSDGDHTVAFLERHDPARVLAECEAKRRIIEGLDATPHDEENCGGGCDGPVDHWRLVSEWQTVCFLTAVYADHPDYRDEWRP